MGDIIKFEFNKPVEVALRFLEPKIFPSNFDQGEDRHMYSTTDERVMFLTPLTSAKIKALHVVQGEVFWICKRKNGRLTDYVVSREPISGPEVEAPKRPARPTPFKTKLPAHLYCAPPSLHGELPVPSFDALPSDDEVPPEKESKLEAQLRASIELAQLKNAPGPKPAPKPAAPTVESRLAPAAAEFSARLVLETNAIVDTYAAALRVASERHGGLVKADDVRTFVVTAYINARKQGSSYAA